MEAYLDNAATTQTFPEVCDIVKRVIWKPVIKAYKVNGGRKLYK